MPIARHLRRIALLVCVSAPLLASPVVPLAGVGLNRQVTNRGCAFVGKRLYCWGDNSFGQLGTGAASVTSLAEWVPRPDTRNGDFISPTSIGVGLGDHICVTDAGSVWCWGKNYAGQLGLGDRILREQPTRVPGLPGDIQEVATGYDHACARSATDGVWCWGLNAYGQTGQQPPGGIEYDPNTLAVIGPAQSLPQQVPGLPDLVDSIALGSLHTCALAGGRVYCWGRNFRGELGDSGFTDRATPAVVTAVPADVRAIGVGAPGTSCALTGDGGVWCWGQNAWGEVGRPTTNYQNPTPLRVAGLPGPATALSVRAGTNCAAVAGLRWCWGQSDAGIPTDGVPQEAPRPEGAPDDWLGGCFARGGVLQCPNASTRYPWRQVDAQPVAEFEGDVAQLGLGRSFGCALTTDGDVWCWGRNDSGQRGNGQWTESATASRIPLPTARTLAVGSTHACATTVDGLWCWGNNRWGALGNGSDANNALPVRAQFDGTLVAAGEYHTCAWNAADGLRCWGANYAGQVDGVPSPEPVLTGARPLGAAKVVELALGRVHSCATIELDGGQRESRCWGDLPLTPNDLLSQHSSDPAPRLLTAGAALPGESHPLLRSVFQSACLGDLCYGRSYLPPDRGERRVGVRVGLPEGLSSGFVLGGRLVCAQGVGSDLRCAALNSRACDYELELNPFMGSQMDVCRKEERALAPIERAWLPVIGLPARPQQLAAGDDLACGTIGHRIWCWGPGSPLGAVFPLPPLASSFSPVYRAGAIEPAPRVALPRDPSRQCPAYAVASVSLLDPANPAAAGYWGLALELADGSRYFNGGLNFGGYGSGVGEGVPGYAAFSIQNPSGAPQIVNLDLSGDGGKFELLVLSTRPPSTEPTVMLREILILGEAQKRRSLTLPNGYHVVSLQPATGTSLFLVAAGTTQLDGSPAAFQGGAVVGGYLAGERSGFAAICAADASAITLRTQARSSGDAAGAGDLKLRVIEGQTGRLLFDSRD